MAFADNKLTSNGESHDDQNRPCCPCASWCEPESCLTPPAFRGCSDRELASGASRLVSGLAKWAVPQFCSPCWPTSRSAHAAKRSGSILPNGIFRWGSNDDTLGHALRGVSVTYLATTLMQEVEFYSHKRSATIYEIEPSVIRLAGANRICSRDGKLGAAYVDCLEEGTQAGRATLMLSYSWSYSIGDIADSLQQFCVDTGLPQHTTYVWICCLCVNQHRVQRAANMGESVPFADFQRAFGERVAGIGHLVAMMSPWRRPKYIERIWCNFEMFTALSIGEPGCRVSVVMPARESRSLEAALMEGKGIDEVWRTLADLRVERAQASVETDRQNIFHMITNPPGPGFHRLNSMIAKHLQAWVVRAASGYVLRRLDTIGLDGSVAVSTCAQVGELLMRVGMLELAATVLEKGCRTCVDSGCIKTETGVHLIRQLGIAKRESGDLDEAEKLLIRGKTICDDIGNLQTTSGASLLSSIGFVKYEKGRNSEALDLYEQAVLIRDATDTLNTPDGAMLMRNIGVAKQVQGDHEGALDAFEVARSIHESLGTLVTPVGALVLTSIASVHREKGDIEGALTLYDEAKSIRERTGTLDSPYGADLLRLIGIVRREQGNMGQALELFEKALAIREETKSLITPDGACLLSSKGYAMYELGRPDIALQLYAQARKIREDVGVFDTPDGALLCRNIGAAHAALGETEQAMSCYNKASQIYESTGIMRTSAGAWLLTSIGVAKLEHGDVKGAHELFKQATDIREENETMDTMMGKELLELTAKAAAELEENSPFSTSPHSVDDVSPGLSRVSPWQSPMSWASSYDASPALAMPPLALSRHTSTGPRGTMIRVDEVVPLPPMPVFTNSKMSRLGSTTSRYAESLLDFDQAESFMTAPTPPGVSRGTSLPQRYSDDPFGQDVDEQRRLATGLVCSGRSSTHTGGSSIWVEPVMDSQSYLADTSDFCFEEGARRNCP